MSRRNKLQKFEELRSFPNVLENFDPKNPMLTSDGSNETHLKGKWSEKQFKNNNPITLELACGGGEYTLALAETYMDRNFIGVDIKGARIWKGATKALQRNLENVAFLRTRIEQLDLFFAENEVEEIWITFPDPFLRESKENRRLTAPRFLDCYKKLLKPNGVVHLKTDDPTLYEWSLEVLSHHPGVHIIYQKDDIYNEDLAFPELEFKTFYEIQHLADNRKIKYISFSL